MEFDKVRENLVPFFKSGRMTMETVLMLEKEGSACGNLAFEPLKINSVTDYTGKRVYKEGKDYIAEGRKIKLVNTELPRCKFSELVGKDIGFFPASDKINKVYCAEGPFLQDRQICVDYEFDLSKCSFKSEKDGLALKNSIDKLEGKNNFNLLFYGDSITTGCSSSSWQKLPPMRPSYPEMVTAAIEYAFERKVDYFNTAVGGMGTDWALENVKERLIDIKPDLVILAFGINDGILLNKEKYYDNTYRIIERAKESKPDTEFILVDCFTPSPYALTENFIPFLGSQRSFWEADEELSEKFDGVTVAKVGKAHDELLKNKFYADMLVNNINHPNDFLSAVFAQVILSKITDKFSV